MHMKRKNILALTKEIIKLLKKERELSGHSISQKLGVQWRTAIKSLEFLKDIGIVKERKGKKTKTYERLFSLK